MQPLEQFSIPIKKIKSGIHQFDFQLDKTFFKSFKDSMVQDGTFNVQLEVDKRPDMFVLDFEFTGTVKTTCDRCLVDIDLPVEGKEQLIVKLAEEPSEEDEIIYITDRLIKFNVAKYIYEYVSLSLPIVKVYDCENDDPIPCNETILDILDPEEREEPEEKQVNPIWDELKKLNKN